MENFIFIAIAVILRSREKKKISARVEDRSTHDKIKDAAATYAGRFFVMLLDTELPEKLLHELQNFNEHLLLGRMTILQDGVKLLPNRGTGVVQRIYKEIVS